MPTLLEAPSSVKSSLASLSPDAIDAALKRIPPLWPLSHFVAVNPFVGLLDHSFAKAAALLQRTTGAAPLQSPAAYLEAFAEGKISAEDLARASDGDWTPERLCEAIAPSSAKPAEHALGTVADLLDEKRPRAHWSTFVVEEISKWCAITYDENQTTWNSPWKNLGLYSSWREAAVHDHNPESFGLKNFRAFVASLPADAESCIAHCFRLLAPRDIDAADFFHCQLATIPGWAGYLQYLVREDALRGRANSALRDLLAIRLAYDAALWSAFGRTELVRTDWRRHSVPLASPRQLEALTRWQLAYELGYQRQLAASLAGQFHSPSAATPAAQAVFCIDVRSEIFRRHLEAAHPSIQTLGFAGFFGFPVAHSSVEQKSSARCPVLLVPPVETHEPLPPAAALTAESRHAEAGAWKATQNSAASCFSFVETLGLADAPALGKNRRSAPPTCARPAPDFVNAPLPTRIALAEGALRNMSLSKNFARLVLLCGHGSQSANNPYASALDCGACGGHAGDLNARLAARTLNEPSVRAGLAEKNILIPADTHFVAGLHNTMTDDVELFDTAAVPATHATDLAQLRASLARAGLATRRERAPRLGLPATLSDEKLHSTLVARAADPSQVRPEWALANNAALIAAPRSRTSALNLEGRTFLHDYDASADPELKVLTLILSAPVVVASWINLQYYASRVDPVRYGSGDKVLHNVIGGIGVVEGNSGDLKVGLPFQSIHDGKKFVHEPRRLSVFIEAPREAIEAVLDAQPAVRRLFDHGWIHLFALEGSEVHRYTPDGWQAFA